MRVGFFVWTFPLVSETFVLNLARAALDGGCELDVYSFKAGDETGALHPLIHRCGLLERHHLAASPDSTLARVAALPVALWRAYRTHGRAALRLLPPFSRGRRAWSLRPVFEAATMPRLRHDVLHCQFATLGPVVLVLREAGVLSGRLVLHVRGTDITTQLRRRGDDIYRRAFAAADAVIANSEHFRDAAIRAGCPPEKISVIPSGTDLDAFPFRSPARPTGRPVRIVSVGRLVEKKGYPVALDAIAALVTRGVDLRYDIVGDGPLREALLARSAQLGLENRVRFHGAMSSDGVRDLLARSDLFLAASMTAPNGDQDAATNTVKEAMATGLPVVATRHGGMPEMVVDGETGLLAREGDPVDLADVLRRMIASEADWPRLAAAARARVEAMTSTAVVDLKVLDLYRRLVDGGTASQPALVSSRR